MVFPLSDLGDIEEDANKQNSEKVTTTKGRFLHDVNSVRLWEILCSIPLYPYPRQAAHRTSYEVSMTNRNSWRQLCGEPIAQPPPNPEMCVRADHSTGNYVPYSFRWVCRFFYVCVPYSRLKLKPSTILLARRCEENFLSRKDECMHSNRPISIF